MDRRGVIAVALLTASSALAGPSTAAAADPAPAETVWLCRPGAADNPCTANLDTTVIPPSGVTTRKDAAAAAKKPSIDCFYVYPTVSGQSTVNATLAIDPEERDVARAQASRFSAACRVWAPMYRQLTISAILKPTDAEARATAYNSLLDAWNDYLAHYNKGRPFVVIGHSQGTAMLTRLLQAEIDPKPALRRRMRLALLIGGNVTVPEGKQVGGSFKHIPACTSRSQSGCVVAYSTFTETPPPDSLFGRVRQGVSTLAPNADTDAPMQVLCVNPAALKGGTGELAPYFPTFPIAGPVGAQTGPLPTAPTPWVEFTQRFSATCTTKSGATWLQIDERIEPNGTSLVSRVRGGTWGLHLADVNLALGNLVALVKAQAARPGPR